MDSMPAARTLAPPPLRPYQLEPLRAILRSIADNAGRTFCIEIARQGGKNETSARLEALLLAAHARAGGAIVKTAPTLEPQLRTSFNRLTDYLVADHIPHRTAWPMIHVGRASIDFRSAERSASVVGATASLLLEVDEAQDVDEEIFNTRFRPMASTRNATTVMYGTAWEETDLLQQTIASNAAAERIDGIRRNFLYDWRTVALYNDAYRRFAESEQQRLGPDHPSFTTQYDLRPIAGGGRLLNDAQLAQLQGTHIRERGAVVGADYIAAIDIGGEDTGGDRLNDRTVMTIARIVKPDAAQRVAGLTPCAIVDHVVARGSKHAELIPQLADVLRSRRINACTIDATGIGESTASLLAAAVPRCRIVPFKFTQHSKSEIGFGLITAVNTGALKMYASDGSEEHALTFSEARNARIETRPNATINFHVPESLGNDDFLISMALLAKTAAENPPRRAVGRRA